MTEPDANASTPDSARSNVPAQPATDGPSPMPLPSAADNVAAETNPSGPTPPSAEPPTDSGRPSNDAVVPPPLGSLAHGFRFHGDANEYFRIWIVNTLLTLVTLGIFFPWAKVRKRRYLRGCTELMQHRFDYRADPLRLLVGHVLIVTFFIGYSVFGVVYAPVRYGVLLLGVVLLPWVVARSLSFNAHNTVYRGLRFRFQSSLSSAAMIFLLEPVLIALTLGLYYPAWARSKRRYIVSNHRLGDAYFRFDASVGPFYSAHFIGGFIAIALFIGVAVAAGIYTALHHGKVPGRWIQVPLFAAYGFGWFIARNLIFARLFNHIWNHTRLDDHRFVARMDVGRWLALQLGNLGAVVGTLGLLYPWAVVRAHRYSASCLSLELAGSVGGIQRLESNAGSATGDTAAEFVGLDFGI